MKTGCDVIEYEKEIIQVVRGGFRRTVVKAYYEPSRQRRHRCCKLPALGEHKTVDLWVSDYFGIAVGVR